MSCGLGPMTVCVLQIAPMTLIGQICYHFAQISVNIFLSYYDDDLGPLTKYYFPCSGKTLKHLWLHRLNTMSSKKNKNYSTVKTSSTTKTYTDSYYILVQPMAIKYQYNILTNAYDMRAIWKSDNHLFFVAEMTLQICGW